MATKKDKVYITSADKIYKIDKAFAEHIEMLTISDNDYITEIEEGVRIDFLAIYKSKNLRKLPNGLVLEALVLVGCHIDELPDDIAVNHNLIIVDSVIHDLSWIKNNLSALTLYNCPNIIKLPDVRIEALSMINTPVKTFSPNIGVGSLILEKSPVESIPDISRLALSVRDCPNIKSLVFSPDTKIQYRLTINNLVLDELAIHDAPSVTIEHSVIRKVSALPCARTLNMPYTQIEEYPKDIFAEYLTIDSEELGKMLDQTHALLVDTISTDVEFTADTVIGSPNSGTKWVRTYNNTDTMNSAKLDIPTEHIPGVLRYSEDGDIRYGVAMSDFRWFMTPIRLHFFTKNDIVNTPFHNMVKYINLDDNDIVSATVDWDTGNYKYHEGE